MQTLKSWGLAALIVLIAGCVTINVYFPAAAAEQAAQKFIGNVIGPEDQPPAAPPDAAAETQPAAAGGMGMALIDWIVPAARAADAPDLKVSTPELESLRGQMRARFRSDLKALLDSGALGFAADGLVAIRDPGSLPLAQRNQVRQLVEAENRDRAEVYRRIAAANGHPEWEQRIRETFAREWRNLARPGWYVQDASGTWVQK